MKNRLIGIFMLLLLAAIIWPILFSGESDNEVDVGSRIASDTEYVERFEIAPPEHDLFKEADIQQAEALLDVDDSELDVAQKKIDAVTHTFEQKQAPSYVDTNDAVTSAKVTGAAEAKKSQPSPKKKVKVVDKSPVSWVIQVASFISYDNAEDLVKRLTGAGYKAYIEKANTSKGQRVRVFVGPNLDKNVVERWKKEINKQFKVSAIVSRFKA